VNLSEPPERVKAYVADMKLTFPIVIDASGEVARAYGVRHTPTHFLIDRSGRVRAGGSGSKDWSSPQAHALVRELLEASAEKTSKPARPDRADSPPTRRMERR
jgi:peroxiredoxin